MRTCFLVLSFCLALPPVSNATEVWAFSWGGLSRSCVVDFPYSRAGQTGLPVVFVLHGYGATAASMRNYCLLDVLGDSVGFITVYPEAYNHRWNSGIGDNPTYPTPDVDDVGFVSRIIDSLVTRFAIDTTRVYACGHSNGGFMSLKLAADLSDRIAAVASVSGVLTVSTAAGYTANRPVPVMMMHGTADQVVPYEGGMTGWESVGATVDFWREKDSCLLPPDSMVVPDRDTSDGSTVVEYTYRSSVSTARVELVKVIGGGHTWPGGSPYPQFGETNYDIDADSVIWNFFTQASIPTGVGMNGVHSPEEFSLSQNYPNPFNPTTTIRCGLPHRSHVLLAVYNTLGQKVVDLVNGDMDPGYHEVQFDGRNFASGVYFCRLQAGDFVMTKELILLR
jgi:polyhydroxybutyrate depolymerase